jgi:hypothetical protein
MPSEMWEELVLERSGGKMCKKEEDKIFRKKGFFLKKNVILTRCQLIVCTTI